MCPQATMKIFMMLCKNLVICQEQTWFQYHCLRVYRFSKIWCWSWYSKQINTKTLWRTLKDFIVLTTRQMLWMKSRHPRYNSVCCSPTWSRIKHFYKHLHNSSSQILRALFLYSCLFKSHDRVTICEKQQWRRKVKTKL